MVIQVDFYEVAANHRRPVECRLQKYDSKTALTEVERSVLVNIDIDIHFLSVVEIHESLTTLPVRLIALKLSAMFGHA